MAFKVNNNIVIDDSRNLVNIEAASLAGILTASEIKTAENGDISVGAGGSITAEAIYAVVGGEAVGVATVSASGDANFTTVEVTGAVTAGKFVGVGSELTYLSAASITTSITPTVRPTGEPLQDGDLWFDTTADLGGVRQYTYFDTQWIDSNAAPILSNLVVKDGSGEEEVDFGGGSLDILGGSNINVALTGIGSTARFTANLDEHISLTGMELSGIATLTELKFGDLGQAVTSIVTELTDAADSELPTALAVKTAIDSVQTDLDNLNIVELERIQVAGVSTFQGQAKADATGIGLTVADSAYIGGALEVNGAATLDSLTVDAGATIKTNFSDGTAFTLENRYIDGEGNIRQTTVAFDRVQTGALNEEDSPNTSMVTAGSVLAYLEDATTLKAGTVEATSSLEASAAAGIGLTVKSDAYIGGEATLGSLTVEGATQVEALTVKGDLIVENTATQINFNVKDVAVDDRLIELGTDDGAAPAAQTSYDLGVSLNYHDGTAAKRSALIWSNNAAFNLAAEITDDGADDVNITVASHADLGINALYMGDAETAGNLAIDASKNATLADISASGSFTFGGTAFDSVAGTIGAGSSSPTAIPTAEAVFNYVDTATESVGTASSITLTEDASTNATYYIPFAPDATGDTQLRTDSTQLYYNPSTGTLSSQVFDTLSDINYKENIELISEPIAKVEALRGVNFDWKDGSGASAGIIAQEVQAVMPSLITEHADKLTVNYNGLVGLLVEAVKELSAEVAQLKAAQ